MLNFSIGRWTVVFCKKVLKKTLLSLREAEGDMGCEFEADFYESPGLEIIVFLEYTSGFPQYTASSVSQLNIQLGEYKTSV